VEENVSVVKTDALIHRQRLGPREIFQRVASCRSIQQFSFHELYHSLLNYSHDHTLVRARIVIRTEAQILRLLKKWSLSYSRQVRRRDCRHRLVNHQHNDPWMLSSTSSYWRVADVTCHRSRAHGVVPVAHLPSKGSIASMPPSSLSPLPCVNRATPSISVAKIWVNLRSLFLSPPNLTLLITHDCTTLLLSQLQCS
jgi:hypothetical protein